MQEKKRTEDLPDGAQIRVPEDDSTFERDLIVDEHGQGRDLAQPDDDLCFGCHGY